MTLVVFTSSSEIVCTSERFARSAEGKAVGFEWVTTVLEDVSVASVRTGAGGEVRRRYLCTRHRRWSR
jgi:hypothetical protein